MIKEISEILKNTNELKEYYELVDAGKSAVLAVVSSARPLFVATEFLNSKKAMLVVVAGEKNARAFSNELRMYLGAEFVLDYFADTQQEFSAVERAKQLESLSALSTNLKKIVVIPANALIKKVDVDVKKLLNVKKLQVGNEYELSDLSQMLVDAGYSRLEVLDGPGTFSVKGGTVDIFPAQLSYPVRIDFFGDEIEDIRKIVPSTGQSIRNLDYIRIVPCKKPDEEAELCPISEFINKNVKLVLDEPRAIMDSNRDYFMNLGKKVKLSKQDKKRYFIDPVQVRLKNTQTVQLVAILQSGISPNAKLTLKRPQKITDSTTKEEIIQSYILDGWHVYTEIPAGMSYLIPDAKIAVFPFNVKEIKLGSGQFMDIGKRSFVDITQITFPYKPGDYVVHSFYGIAYFKDIVKREVAGSVRDFLLLEYAENDKLFVPIEQFERITKYVGPAGLKPNLTRLGTADWSRAMSKARKATRKMAFDLVDVYSRRAVAKGHAFAADSKNQIAMEQDFPYIETDDQLAAIHDVKLDMQRSKPMDRLVCGDVGFGKTEVAIRAAYKCVDDGLQVMVLCPTTILAMQHFETFNKRLEKYNTRLEVLSRFKTAKESKKIAEDFAAGNIDILIGTHRLLSRDINPKNLGLIIIDEEQRFGVAHKEQLKNFRESVDVLTLTATPIPRTMQMATSGVRDMSLIMTPPSNRKAVEVYVGQWDKDVVSEAIRRELERGGQIYYISNKVRTIKDAADRVGMAAGEAKIATVHGRMNKTQLESIMDKFSAGEFDVLVSTTIVENGIDNPNTNTLIIEDAQNLGLSQMYQLKGRVGRSVEQAYAYFLFNDKAMLKDDAVARLEAIDEFTDLGSGMQIAMRDLEIRGAGNFLGAEQSGNVSHVGFDLFAQMLKSAVEAAQNYNVASKTSQDEDYLTPSISTVSVNIPGSAYLSQDSILDIEERVVWYRRFSSAQTLDEVESLEKELKSKYEEISDTCENFIWKSKIAALGLSAGFELISVVNNNLILQGKKLSLLQVRELKQIEGIYFDKKKKITIPLNRIIDTSENLLFGQIFDFLLNWEF